ncbi:hypothetical protein [Erythrobacter sp. SG61-1L]|uniref:hypothetical protein n=1 Tax=Erythrobacter sp. SG61-1L TaxID=1603897 RepID=UPI0006C92894|nr:hypothetical protein [Erythrobacter sp. SG61-1L]
MKHYPRRSPRRARHARVPAFSPVPLRARADGWTPARQAAFLAALAITRCVAKAAQRVKMARETAYRLRARPGADSFAAAWDAVLRRRLRGAPEGGRRKVTIEERVQRALFGLLKPVTYRGQHVGTMRKADNSALLGHLARLDRASLPPRDGGGRSQGFAGLSASPLPGLGGASVQRNRP